MTCFLSRRLSALSQARLRLAWFAHWVEITPIESVAFELECLLDLAESFEARPTAALATVVAWIGGAMAPPRLHELHDEAKHRHHYRLSRLLCQAGACPAIPDPHGIGTPPLGHGQSQPLTLGERKSLARRPNRTVIERLVKDPHPAVFSMLLLNPHLKEEDILRFVTRRPPDLACVLHLFRDVRWLLSRRIRMGLLHNPGTPLWQSVPLLCLCSRPELTEIASSPHVPNVLQGLAYEHARRHPPLSPETGTETLH